MFFFCTFYKGGCGFKTLLVAHKVIIIAKVPCECSEGSEGARRGGYDFVYYNVLPTLREGRDSARVYAWAVVSLQVTKELSHVRRAKPIT